MIYVDKENISKSGKEIVVGAEYLQQKIKEIEDAIDKINTAWEGADAIAYLNNMRDKYILALMLLDDRINAYGEYLEKVPDAYTTLDEVYASKSLGV